MSFISLVWILAAVLSTVAPVRGQTVTGTLRGLVMDRSGAVLPGVTVSAWNRETNRKHEVVSGSGGFYTITLLPPGRYRMEAERDGFKKLTRRGIRVRVNEQARADLTLQVGSLTEEVTIVTEVLLLELDSAAQGAVIENAQISLLPLNGREFLELTLLVPGAYPHAPGSPGSVRGKFSVNVNGAREDANNFLLDGVYNTDPILNSFALSPPVDAIREFKIQTGTYDATFGRSAGAQINVVMKSGTNEIHGTVYEFLRNDAVDARNFFALSGARKPKLRRNQFGFSLGGPVQPDRVFFFVDYEGHRRRQGITRATNVPTLAQRQGDFSALLGDPANPTQLMNCGATDDQPCVDVLGRPIFEGEIFDPSTTRLVGAVPVSDGFGFDPVTGEPIAGEANLIPSERLHLAGLAVANFYPLPNPLPNNSMPDQNFVSSPLLTDRRDHFDVRFDMNFGAKDLLVARYSFGDRDLFDPFAGRLSSSLPGFGVFIPRRGQNAMLAETHVFSPHWVNDVRVAFSRMGSGTFPENAGTDLNGQVGLPSLAENPRDFGLSLINVAGFSPLGDEPNNPQQTASNTFQVTNQTGYSRGRHLVRFGTDLRRVQHNAFRDVHSRGFINFVSPSPFTENPLADLLLGLPSFTGGATFDNPQHLRSTSLNLFVQDDWRLTPRLTLNLGLRYEYNLPPVDRFDAANLYDPETRSLIRVGEQGVPRGGYRPDRNNFAPRVGLAWSPFDGGRTVLRAGYGIFYDQSALAVANGLYFNAPFFTFNVFFPSAAFPLTLSDPFPTGMGFSPPASGVTYARNFQTAYQQHWSFDLQQEIDSDLMVGIGYVGSKGTHLVSARDLNQAAASPAVTNLRPDPFFADINQLESAGSSTYHALQLRVRHRFRNGIRFLAAYTLGKSIDNASTLFPSSGDGNFPQNSLDLRSEKGRSNFDVRHRLSMNFSYDLPFGPGRAWMGGAQGFASRLIGGWQVNGIFSLQSGYPFTPMLLTDNSNTGTSLLGIFAGDRPNLLGDPTLDSPDPSGWFNTDAFAVPTFGSFGNAGRNILTGPGFRNVDFSLLKSTALGETLDLQFRAEFFNLFNHPNFDLPDPFVGSTNFGRISSARSGLSGDARQIQFALKLIF